MPAPDIPLMSQRRNIYRRDHDADRCLPDALEPASVEQIIAVAAAAEPALTALVRGVLAQL